MDGVTWQKLEELFTKFPFMKASSVDENEISDAEQKLGIVFDSDYQEFIQRYGGAIVGPYPVLGLRHAEPMDVSQWSVIDVTENYRNEGWCGVEDWYIVSIDHADNPIGIDGKGDVYRSDHDFGVIEKIADSFEDYILSCLNA